MDDRELALTYPNLASIGSPDDLKAIDNDACRALAEEMRQFIVDAVTRSGGHLGSNLGVVETTIAMHRVFSSPDDVFLFDTGHQAYVHKLLTGRIQDFEHLREQGGLSGYPNRSESPHDWIENSHASTALSYAHGIATAFRSSGQEEDRRVIALIGDGALTGGMAYEALNNIGHSNARVLVVLNDNGRSYAPTVSKLSESLTQLRLNPSYSAIKSRVAKVLEDIPGVGPIAGQSLRSMTAALRELVEPHVFFEALGIRYTGPIDGHDVAAIEQALRRASAFPGPIVLHVLTRKGKGYAPAEADEVQHLHDLKAATSLVSLGGTTDTGAVIVGPRSSEKSYTEAFSQALVEIAKVEPRLVAITAAMPGPTGLLPFAARFPKRFFDVGIAEQHAMTTAAGMAMGGLRPVVAIYSTFLSRAFDQQNFDVGLLELPVVICADRAGITGDDGPSHHGVLDLVLGLAVADLAIFAPSEPAEIEPMLKAALELGRPALIRYPKTPGPAHLAPVGTGMKSRVLRSGTSDVAIVGYGKMASAALGAAEILAQEGIDVTVFDPRIVRPLDEDLVEACVSYRVVITAEDGIVHGGAGQYLRSQVEELVRSKGVAAPTVNCLGVPTRYLAHTKPDAILQSLGLDGKGIAESMRAVLRLDDKAPVARLVAK